MRSDVSLHPCTSFVTCSRPLLLIVLLLFGNLKVIYVQDSQQHTCCKKSARAKCCKSARRSKGTDRDLSRTRAVKEHVGSAICTTSISDIHLFTQQIRDGARGRDETEIRATCRLLCSWFFHSSDQEKPTERNRLAMWSIFLENRL